MTKYKDLTGQKFNRLTVLEYEGLVPRADGRNRSNWKVQCDCGNIKSVIQDQIVSGSVKSCGCLGIEVRKSRLPKMIAANTKTADIVGINTLYNRYKNSAINRGLMFSLPKEQFSTLIKNNCYYCGQVPKSVVSSVTGIFLYNGIDRVNNDQGYIDNNVVTCCETCNKAKLTQTQDEFESWILRAADHIRLRK